MKADDDAIYMVIINHEEQYSIWSLDRQLPAGWTFEGTKGKKDVCLAHIAEVWTDMRPASLRKYMQDQRNNPGDET